MPLTARERAWRALSDSLRATLPSDAKHAFVGNTHVQRFADNLLPGLSLNQVHTVRAQLEAGAGGELTPTRTGKRPAHAPYSSAAFAANLFGRWLGAEPSLRIAALTGFNQPLKIEHKLKIKHGGGTANLDCFLEGPTIVVGIESKLTETLAAHAPVTWKPNYATEAMADLLTDGWRAVFLDSLSRRWTPQHLGLEQLLKHALALSSHADHREAHLVYCHWEPTNRTEIIEVRRHGAEIDELAERLGAATPRLHRITYQTLVEQWARLTTPSWIAEHVNQLADRYTLSI
jgi:hypothetical protein